METMLMSLLRHIRIRSATGLSIALQGRPPRSVESHAGIAEFETVPGESYAVTPRP